MTMVLGRYESNKWKKKIETGDFVQLDGAQGELVVKRLV